MKKISLVKNKEQQTLGDERVGMMVHKLTHKKNKGIWRLFIDKLLLRRTAVEVLIV